MKTERNYFVSHEQENEFPSPLIVYWKMSSIVYNIHHNQQMLSYVYGLSCSYLDIEDN